MPAGTNDPPFYDEIAKRWAARSGSARQLGEGDR
jgi:hypothetical protein